MRILILSQWFDPEPTVKGLVFAKELVNLGHEVEVLTGFPNYPGGKLYPGYRIKFFQRELIDGISVIRVPLYPSHDNSSIKRILNYVSFALSAALLGPLFVKQADIMYVYHAPATIALPAFVLKYMRGFPFVYDINDLWPDTLSATKMIKNKTILNVIGLWCHLTYKMASHVVVVTPGFKRKLLERGVREDKVSIIYNWCNENKITIMDRNEAAKFEPEMAGHFNIVFTGNIGKAQALDAVLGAAALIAQRLPLVQFVFIGGGVDVVRLKQVKEDMQLTNVLFLPFRPMSKISSALCIADVLLAHLDDDPLFEITLPSKNQTYLSVGRPILMAVRGDASQLVERSGGGLVCTPGDPESIAEAVVKLATMTQEERDNIGKAGANFYSKELSLAVGTRHFETIFKLIKQSQLN